MIAVHELTPVDMADSKIQLILAGERLFAERGVEAASLREIAVAAGHGNNNAVRYHFGSKQGLVQAIFRHRVVQMEPVRAKLMARLEAASLETDTRSIFEVIVLPYFTLRAPDGTFSYPAFILQYLLYHRPRGIQHAADEAGALSSALNTAHQLLRSRIGYLAPEIVEGRILHAMITFVTAIISAENAVPKLSTEQYRAHIDDAIDQAVASMVLQNSPRDASLVREFANTP
ncbi:TetR family transcriptional regulator [Novosphingobium sp. SL115]|uniref:TetR/AcrR family transcriptional regulator n=1 Tax=Novosphingobium sp. SL115 TaxID=2995150 RepID=UPI002276F42E|nr:TetR/AcrR family transcriptional regulator [Novosphingobium sp. SL115]MCY1669662.1 TetR family transcriptional regulator [Novosphingobium sp. SL115]